MAIDQHFFHSRRTRVASVLVEKNIPALLVTNLYNIRYLTGFSGSNATLLLKDDASSLLITDGRYTTQVSQETEGVEILIANDTVEQIKKYTAHTPYAEFHIEPTMSVQAAQAYGNPPLLSEVVEKARMVKDSREIEALLEAGRLADSVFTEFLEAGGIRQGITEKEAAADLEYRLRRAGADALSFDTILASGANASKPHAGVSQDVIIPGLVTIDFGIYLDGYASDQTRTVCVSSPDSLAQELYELNHAAFQAGVATLAPSVPLLDVDTACRRVITEGGYGDYFVHSTGHGVGLEVHEAPYAAARTAPDSLWEVGMTITVEPGIYLPEKTGLRIENTYVLTEEGPQSCNPSTTDMIVID